MQFFRSALLPILMTLLVSSAALAQDPTADCDPESQLKKYLKSHGVSSSVILTFDHQARVWKGYRWDGVSSLDLLQDDVDIKVPFTNKPRLFLMREQLGQLEVFVTNSNPLLFGTQDSDNTVANIEDLANLQKFTGLLGNFLSSAVGGLSPEFRLPQPVQEEPRPEEIFGEMVNLDFAFEEATAEIAAMPQPDPLPELVEAAKEIADNLKDSAKALQGALDAMDKPRGELELHLQNLKEAGAEIKSYVQLVESGRPEAVQTRDFSTLPNFTLLVNESAQDVAEARPTLSNFKPLCPTTLTSLREALRIYRIPLPDKAAERRLAVDQFDSSLENLKDLEGCPNGLDVPIAKVRDYLDARAPSSNGAGENEDLVLRPLFQSIDAYLTLVERRKTALKTAGDLLATSGDAAKVGEAVNDFRLRFKNHLVPGDTCSLRTGVLPVSRNRDLDPKLRWTQFGTDSIQIVANSPFKGDALLRHAELTPSFEIQRAWRWDFDVDVATYYTKVADPAFDAVDKDGDGPGTTKVINQTDEDSRAGGLAMFLGLQWRPRKSGPSLFSVGPQLGVGVSADHPAVFAGVGFGLGRYLKLGVGWTWQEVKELDQGQTLGETPVAAKEAIRTREGYDNDYYISLSITIDELPFFKAP